MPRYFFHFFDESTKHLVKDFEGAVFSDAEAAKKEAVGLARDIAGHGLHGSAWHILVTDAKAANVLSVSLSKARPPQIKPWLDLGRRIAFYEPKLQAQIFTWLLMAVVLAMIIQAALLK